MSDQENMPFIHITASAHTHFKSLLEKEGEPGIGLRVFVERPGLPSADVNIAFCASGKQEKDDMALDYGHFILFVEQASVAYLRDTQIDYKQDEHSLREQLVIVAPYLRGESAEATALVARVNHILETEINPGLAGHGGRVRLVEITPAYEVVLQFGGGCHGCGMVDVTLREGIQKAIQSHIPEITAVLDITDHSQGENPYYV